MSYGLPTTSGTKLLERMTSRGRAERVPLQADIEIIGTCNFKCVHCYIAPVAKREDVMPLEHAELIFDKLAAAGTLRVLLTGGEIFTHRQFKEIYLAAKKRGFVIALNTNAYLIGKRWADFLAEHPPKIISISLYGLTEESYERVTGIPNSFQRCVDAIDMLVARGLVLDLKCPGMTLTAPEMPAMKAFAEARGIPFRWDPNLTPRRDGAAEPLRLQMTPEEVLEMTHHIDPGLESLRRFSEGRVGPRPGNKVYQCGAGISTLAINVHGGVTTCTSSRHMVGNLVEQSFEEVWESLGNKVDRKFPDGHPCATCKFRAMCAGCPATVEQLTGLPEGYVQEYCRITHLQAKALGHHDTGIPMTVTSGIPAHVRTPTATYRRALPVLA